MYLLYQILRIQPSRTIIFLPSNCIEVTFPLCLVTVLSSLASLICFGFIHTVPRVFLPLLMPSTRKVLILTLLFLYHIFCMRVLPAPPYAASTASWHDLSELLLIFCCVSFTASLCTDHIYQWVLPEIVVWFHNFHRCPPFHLFFIIYPIFYLDLHLPRNIVARLWSYYSNPYSSPCQPIFSSILC